MKFTFNNDKTKILKIEFSGLYTNADSRNYSWSGQGIGINKSSSSIKNAYVFKNRDVDDYDKYENTSFGDVFDIWNFKSEYLLDHTGTTVALKANKGSKASITVSYDLTEDDNAKLNADTTYYVHIILQGWHGTPKKAR